MIERLAGIERLDLCLRANARLQPDALALRYARGALAGTELTWRELDHRADAIAAFLVAQGVRPGDRCAIFLADDPAALASVYAVMRIGAAVVPIDPFWGDTSIRNIIAHAEVSWMLGADAATLSRHAPSDAVGRTPYASLPVAGAAAAAADRDDPDEVALIAFTSGTTSDPKGVVITHRQIRAAYRIGAEALAIERPQRFACVFRVSGLGILGVCFLFAAVHGAGTVLLPEIDGASARRFWADCDAHKIDFVYLVPAVVQLINRLAAPPAPGAHVPLCAVAAAPLPVEAFDTFKSRFPAKLRNIYGLTELSFAILFGAPGPDGRGLLTIGDGGAVGTRLVDGDGTIVAGRGEGELQILSPSACSGYWRNPQASAALFTPDGWVRTGDLVRRDEHGHYHVAGRLKDVVIHGGFNIHLADVDETLLAHPLVLGASSVGLPDPVYGEIVAGAVHVADPEAASERDLLAWSREHLGVNRAPKRIFRFAEALPLNGAGKTVRHLVKAEIERRLAEETRA